MFGALPPPVAIPCPRCHAQPTMVVYRYFSTVVIACPACEHLWNAEPSSHPALTGLAVGAGQSHPGA